jgi:hypothetical protein
LLLELGRYFVSQGAAPGQCNQVWYAHMDRSSATATRLRAVQKRLGDACPDWPPALADEWERFRRQLTDNQRKARLTGKEIDAALGDPRWATRAGAD